MRKAILIVLFALAIAACGGADSSMTTEPAALEAESSTAAPQSTEVPSADDAAETTTTTAPAEDEVVAESEAPSFDGPPAPDFELALDDGSTFLLSGEQKPVYLIFWAEW